MGHYGHMNIIKEFAACWNNQKQPLGHFSNGQRHEMREIVEIIGIGTITWTDYLKKLYSEDQLTLADPERAEIQTDEQTTAGKQFILADALSRSPQASHEN